MSFCAILHSSTYLLRSQINILKGGRQVLSTGGRIVRAQRRGEVRGSLVQHVFVLKGQRDQAVPLVLHRTGFRSRWDRCRSLNWPTWVDACPLVRSLHGYFSRHRSARLTWLSFHWVFLHLNCGSCKVYNTNMWGVLNYVTVRIKILNCIYLHWTLTLKCGTNV